MSLIFHPPAAEQTTLYFRQGSSDKVYQVRLEAVSEGYLVHFAFGRRGSTMQTGTKTDRPVPYSTAKKLYDQLIREKTAKGYTLGEDGVPYQQTSRSSRNTGITPQLLNPIESDEAKRLLDADEWWTQEKFDGQRRLLLKSAGQVLGINRSGLVVPLPETIADLARSLVSPQFLLDGEQVGEVLHVFDLLELDGQDLRSLSYRQRMMRLELLLDNTDAAIRPVVTARNSVQKRALFDELQNRHAEGIVFKRADASYSPGRPNTGGDQLKLKFVETASCLVAGSNGTRRSVKLELIDENGSRVSVGSVTIPPNRPGELLRVNRRKLILSLLPSVIGIPPQVTIVSWMKELPVRMLKRPLP